MAPHSLSPTKQVGDKECEGATLFLILISRKQIINSVILSIAGTLYYILSVGGMVIVRCTEYRGCPLLGGSLSINAMLNSIRVIEFVRCTEVVRFLEGPLWEVPL